MNIENQQQGSGRGDGEINELILVLLIPKGIDFDFKKIHMCLLRDRENLKGKHVH